MTINMTFLQTMALMFSVMKLAGFISVPWWQALLPYMVHTAIRFVQHYTIRKKKGGKQLPPLWWLE